MKGCGYNKGVFPAAVFQMEKQLSKCIWVITGDKFSSRRIFKVKNLHFEMEETI